MKKPTLASLAADLKVSRQTVSNVLNGTGRVAPQTKTRVEDAIRAAGYRPSIAARSLRTQRTHTLAMRLSNEGDGINGAVMDRFLHALVTDAGRRGYRIVLFTAENDSAELDLIREFRDSKAVDGVILTSTHDNDERPEAVTELGVPLVAFGRPWGRDSSHSWVDVDGEAGVDAATRALLETVDGPIGFIGWPDPVGVGADRRAGWVKATGYSTADQARYSATRFDGASEGADAMRELYANGVRAVVCASDSLAVGALDELRRRGVEHPAVVGFDDTPVARMVGLSSVQQPVAEVATAVLDLLLATIGDPRVPPRTLLLAPTLQLRTVASLS